MLGKFEFFFLILPLQNCLLLQILYHYVVLCVFFFGNMGKTVKHLCCNYGFNRYNVLDNRTISDIFKLKLSDEQQRTVDQVHELLTARHVHLALI